MLTAASAAEAGQVLASGKQPPDAILADYQLADRTTGVRAVAAVRAAVCRDIPARLIAGDTAPERIQEMRATGLLLLIKPVAPVRLRAALTHLLRG